MAEAKYNRVLLKISGRSFCSAGGFGIDGRQLNSIAQTICKIRSLGAQIALVNGAGNYIRGKIFAEKSSISQHTADYMGMLATIINACALQETLVKMNQPTVVLSAIEVAGICEKFSKANATVLLDGGTVLILAGGTGNPFFTTDTCAALRASELEADLLIKATDVDGVYTDDPDKNPKAQLLDKLTYAQMLEKDLRVMDHAAISLARENNIPIVVLNIFKAGNIEKAICGQKVGTIIS